MNQDELNYTSIIDIINDRKGVYLNETEAKRIKTAKENKKDGKTQMPKFGKKEQPKQDDNANKDTESDADRNNKKEDNFLDDFSDDDIFKEKIDGPRMKIVEGQIVIDEESLYLKSTPKERSEYNVSQDKISNPRKRKKRVRWTENDTEKFFNSLRLLGTNFSAIARLFPERNRKDIKNKYKKEERAQPEKIDFILRNPLPICFFLSNKPHFSE
ncbi:hypothetical protein MHBO_001110 [Bonamia ostreae]|uniref:HTH myb-type domain-containing protein n=1 Tax=Bonamia ostreae TaxID=126728 RepID=A0ABV2AHU0_9EUKA